MEYRLYKHTVEVGWELIPIPQKMPIGLQDVSKPDAGRVESGDMVKAMMGRCPKFTFKYENQYSDVINTAISLTNDEYFDVLYPDMYNGGVYVWDRFYRGDINTDIYNGAMDIWESVELSLIKVSPQSPHTVYHYKAQGSVNTPSSISITTDIGDAANETFYGSITQDDIYAIGYDAGTLVFQINKKGNLRYIVNDVNKVTMIVDIEVV